jgi:hypothetical protein
MQNKSRDRCHHAETPPKHAGPAIAITTIDLLGNARGEDWTAEPQWAGQVRTDDPEADFPKYSPDDKNGRSSRQPENSRPPIAVITAIRSSSGVNPIDCFISMIADSAAVTTRPAMMPLSITTSLSRSPLSSEQPQLWFKLRTSASVPCQARIWTRPRRFIAVERHPGELYRRVDFIVTMSRPTKRVIALLGPEPYESRPERDE